MSPIINQSQTARDALTGVGLCGSNPNKVAGGYQARCGYGTRLPFLVISPWAKQNYVDDGVTDQTSIIRFTEDNWQTGRIGDYSFDALAGDELRPARLLTHQKWAWLRGFDSTGGSLGTSDKQP
jgi:phospholipase C